MHDSPGVLQAAYYLPDKVMTATDIRKAISSGRKAEVEAAVKQASAMLQQLQVSAGVSAKALGIFRTNCILWVVDKRHKEVCRIESIDHAGNLFIEMLKEMTGNSSIQSPWSSQQTSDTANVAPKVTKRAEKTTTFLAVIFCMPDACAFITITIDAVAIG